MLKFVSSACAALMVVTAPMATPALGMPMPAPAPAWDQGASVIQVQDRRSGFSQRGQRHWRGDGRHWRGDRNWRGDRRHWRGDRALRRGNHAYWRGHRGYRNHRPGYRRQGDFWFPPAAFALGAIIGGAIASQPPAPRYRGAGNAHVEWCYGRYRSYRASDNTFQPYNGPRRQCHSPYG